MNDDDDLFKSLQEDLEKLHELDNDAIQPNLSAKSFADLDSEVVTSAFFSNDDDNSPKLLKGRMKRAKMIKMMTKICLQRVLQLMKLKTRWKRCKTLLCSVRAGTKFAP